MKTLTLVRAYDFILFPPGSCLTQLMVDRLRNVKRLLTPFSGLPRDGGHGNVVMMSAS
jgi:hypothetical protein